MALQKAFTSASGVEMAQAYHRIIRFSGGTSQDAMLVVLGVYKDAAARQADKKPVEEVSLSVDLNPAATSTMFGDMYTAVKGLTEYSDASDV